MDTIVKLCIGGLIGIGIGTLVGQYEIDKLETERDDLLLRNKCLKATNDMLDMECDVLKENNKLFANLLTQTIDKNEEDEET